MNNIEPAIMDSAKIVLSSNEMELVQNAEVILTKNRIMQKAWWLLEGLQDTVTSYVKSNNIILPEEVRSISAKISRGENYKGLPYLVLDFPRFFTKEDAMAIRTMFWWGNFFSVTLHLSGKYKKGAEASIVNSLDRLSEAGYYIGNSDNEWEHHFGEDNYTELRSLEIASAEKRVRECKTLKLAHNIPLADWDAAPDRLLRYFGELIVLVKDQLPMR